MPSEALQATVALIKDIITSLAAIVAGYVALAGVNAWRKQLTGKTEYEAARRLLKAIYTVRNAINLVRNPVMRGGEIIRASQQASIDIPSSQQMPLPESVAAAYQERWKTVSGALTDLDAEAYEAEVLWGQDIRALLQPIYASATELYRALQIFVRFESQDQWQQDPVRDKRIRAIVFRLPDPNQDAFATSLSDSVKTVEQFLRPHIADGSGKPHPAGNRAGVLSNLLSRFGWSRRKRPDSKGKDKA
jgi:hypothetical protein